MKKEAKKVAAVAIKKIANKMAVAAYGSASWWGMHQIKEPKERKKA